MSHYQAYEYLSRSAQIMHEGLSLMNDLTSHPANPFTQTWPGKLTKASLETAMRLTRRYDKVGFNIDEVEIEDKVFLVREETALAKPFCNLIHFNRLGKSDSHKVLLVAPLSGHFATLLKGTV